MSTPEELARQQIDALLVQCGWGIQNYKPLDLSAARGIAIREVRLNERANLGRQALADWSSSDKTSSEGEARRVSAGSANQFHQFVTPDTGRKFTELYNGAVGDGATWTLDPQGSRAGGRVINRQHLTSNHLDPVARVTICSIQRLYAILRRIAFVFVENVYRKARTTRGDRQAVIFVAQRVATLH